MPRILSCKSAMFAASAVMALIISPDSPAQTPSLFFDQAPEGVKAKINASLQCDWWAAKTNGCSRPNIINVNALKNGVLENVQFYAARAYDSVEDRGRPGPSVEQKGLIDIVATLFPDWMDARSWMADTLDRTNSERYQACIRVRDASIYVRYERSGYREEGSSYVVITPKDHIAEFKSSAWWEDDHVPDTCAEFPRDGRSLVQ